MHGEERQAFTVASVNRALKRNVIDQSLAPETFGLQEDAALCFCLQCILDVGQWHGTPSSGVGA